MNKKIKIFTDGGSRGNPGPSASSFVIFDDENILAKGSIYLGIGTNNNAEYQAVILAMKWLNDNSKAVRGVEVNFYLDSELVVNQLNGIYRIKNENIKYLVEKINQLKKEINIKIQFHAIRRENNKLADQLVNECLDAAP